MGYTTDFKGKFKVMFKGEPKALDKETKEYLVKFSETRRMIRKFPKNEYGVDGEFYVGGKGFMGQDADKSVVDHNRPPSTQPALWCQWTPSKDGKYLQWDGGEKFYSYVEWLEYILKNFLTPKGYSLEGVVHWVGEDDEDIGTIHATDGKVLTKQGVHAKSLVENSVKFIKEMASKKKRNG